MIVNVAALGGVNGSNHVIQSLLDCWMQAINNAAMQFTWQERKEKEKSWPSCKQQLG